MNEMERRWCDFTSWSAVQCLSYHAKNIGLLNRRMVCHAYVVYPLIPPSLAASMGCAQCHQGQMAWPACTWLSGDRDIG